VTALAYWRVDAFADRPFGGNPAAVILVTTWPSDETMQLVAMEMALSETAFVGPDPDGPDPDRRRLRWFTPEVEVDLCGHATLATGHVVLTVLEPHRPSLDVVTRSGALRITRYAGGYAIDLPARPPAPVDDPALVATIADAIGAPVVALSRARDLVAEVSSADAVRRLAPDPAKLAAIDTFGLIVTAAGDRPGIDFVSRFFAPREGIFEDPVTGSAHCTLAPYWSPRVGRSIITGRQESRRGGTIGCELRGDRVILVGNAIMVGRGQVFAP
jgi:PhzF family phenazine biosynthesis protein